MVKTHFLNKVLLYLRLHSSIVCCMNPNLRVISIIKTKNNAIIMDAATEKDHVDRVSSS